MTILLFAGTQNGRELALNLAQNGFEIIVSSLTEHGSNLLPEHENIISIQGEKSIMSIIHLVTTMMVDVVIDSTHPYATEISFNLKEVRDLTGVKLIRYERAGDIEAHEGLHFDNMTDVCLYLKNHSGNVLLTTGVNQVSMVCEILNKDRVFTRVLPVKRSLDMIKSSTLPMDQVITKHPPFTYEDNIEHISQWDIKYLVTKNSGKAGRTREKVQAAASADIELLVIDRPKIDYEYKAYDSDTVIGMLKTME